MYRFRSDPFQTFQSINGRKYSQSHGNCNSSPTSSLLRSYMTGSDVNEDYLKVAMLPPTVSKFEAKAVSRKKTGKDLNMSNTDILPSAAGFLTVIGSIGNNNFVSNTNIKASIAHNNPPKYRSKKSNVQFSNKDGIAPPILERQSNDIFQVAGQGNDIFQVAVVANLDCVAEITKKPKKTYTKKNKGEIIALTSNNSSNNNQQTSMAPPSITPFRGKKRNSKSGSSIIPTAVQDSFSSSSSSLGMPYSALAYDNNLLTRNHNWHGSGLTPDLNNLGKALYIYIYIYAYIYNEKMLTFLYIILLGLLDQSLNYSFDGKCDTPNFFGDISASGSDTF